MKAMQVEGSMLVAAGTPQPRPGAGEILIKVHAAGVIVAELQWYPTTHTSTGEPRRHAIPAHEFSGEVAALGEGTSGFTVGQEVYGMNDWYANGAIADYCITQLQSIAPRPESLTHEEAATIPISALTAWQGLFVKAKLQPKERVLVHGGAGAVGMFVTQLASRHGAHVIVTASASDREFAMQLGAAEVIDYKTTSFEDVVRNIDVVFDTVGGDTAERSLKVLKPSGRLVTIPSDVAATTNQRVKDAFFIVEPNQQQLVEITKLLNAGTLKTFVKAIVPFAEAAEAYSGKLMWKGRRGKIVIKIV